MNLGDYETYLYKILLHHKNQGYYKKFTLQKFGVSESEQHGIKT